MGYPSQLTGDGRELYVSVLPMAKGVHGAYSTSRIFISRADVDDWHSGPGEIGYELGCTAHHEKVHVWGDEAAIRPPFPRGDLPCKPGSKGECEAWVETLWCLCNLEKHHKNCPTVAELKEESGLFVEQECGMSYDALVQHQGGGP